MHAIELRVGNLVLYRDKIFEILSIGNTSSATYNSFYVDLDSDILDEHYKGIDIEEINPIQLTEEWLLKLGFTKKIDSETLTVFWIGHNKLTHDYLFEVKYIEGYPFFYRNGTHAIHHVHQLQNLYYALTNQELTIKE